MDDRTNFQIAFGEDGTYFARPLSQNGGDLLQEESISGKLVSLVGDLGTAALTALQPGASKEPTQMQEMLSRIWSDMNPNESCEEFSSVDESGEGIEMAVSKPSLSEVLTPLGRSLHGRFMRAAGWGWHRLEALWQ